MIDTDKMRAAYAATPLCQNAWTKRDDDPHSPTRLCAVSAMVSFAGVQPELIRKMDLAHPLGQWVHILAVPVLLAEYGVPREVVNEIVKIFDAAENEWRGVTEVLALCERHNMDELHEQAIHEDGVLFGVPIVAAPFGFLSGGTMTITFNGGFGDTIAAKPKKAKTRKEHQSGSKFWTAPTTPAIAKKHTGKLVVA